MGEYSFTSLDVGFDLRAHEGMQLELPADISTVRYLDRANHEVLFSGTREAIRTALESAGYRVREGAP